MKRWWPVYAFGLVSLHAAPAMAYIDGALASQIFQVLIAGGLAAILFLKHFWLNVRTFVETHILRRAPAKHPE